MGRNVYLKMKTLKDARKILKDRFFKDAFTQSEKVEVTEARSRVLAEPVFALLSSPNCHAAAMDGIAVRASLTYGAAEGSPKRLAVGKEAFFVNTGHLVPEETDSVIMIEHVRTVDEHTIEIEAPAFPYQYVRKMGEDIVATELMFPTHHKITPSSIAALLTGGVRHVSVRRRPHVHIIPTGSELVSHEILSERALKPGEVIESNSFLLQGLIEEAGGVCTLSGKVLDDADSIRDRVKEAVLGAPDMVLVIGGSSAGSEDYSRAVIENLGKVIIHGVTIMPGKPVVIGDVSGKPVFGVPGYPVSAIIVFEQLIKPLLLRMHGESEIPPVTVSVSATRKLFSKLGVEEFIRVKLGKVDDRVVAIPLPRGAGSITSFTQADGIIRIPADSEGVDAGVEVKAEMIRSFSEIEKTIVMVGSHDNTLDILSDLLKKDDGGIVLSSSHVGSMGGLMAVKKGGAHVAGIHLLDVEDGTYNISYVRKYTDKMRVKLVHLVEREQGLIVLKGNPKGISGICDLARKDVVFINRQVGSGTRILLDYHLKEKKIDSSKINGYRNDEYTHMAVAVAVLGNVADAGMGIAAAASALGLDFIPVAREHYDLVIPEKYFDTEKIDALLRVIRSCEFKDRVGRLSGYHTGRTGELV